MRPDSGTVVVSYAPADALAVGLVIAALEKEALAVCIPVRQPGQAFSQTITDALATSAVVILMVSDDYLRDRETMQALRMALEADESGILVIPLVVRRCNLEGSWIGRLPVHNGNAAPLIDLPSEEHQRLLSRLVDLVKGATTRVHGPPPGTIATTTERSGIVPKEPFGFIVTSFAPVFDEDSRAIAEAMTSARMIPVRTDQMPLTFQVDSVLLRLLADADVVVVNASADRPNVYFELGFALACGTPVIICTKVGVQVHFDVRNWNRLVYTTAADLRTQLPAWIEAARRRRPRCG